MSKRPIKLHFNPYTQGQCKSEHCLNESSWIEKNGFNGRINLVKSACNVRQKA